MKILTACLGFLLGASVLVSAEEEKDAYAGLPRRLPWEWVQIETEQASLQLQYDTFLSMKVALEKHSEGVRKYLKHLDEREQGILANIRRDLEEVQELEAAATAEDAKKLREERVAITAAITVVKAAVETQRAAMEAQCRDVEERALELGRLCEKQAVLLAEMDEKIHGK